MVSKFTESINLDDPDNEWIGERFLDISGRVLKWGQYYVRAIYKERVPFFQKLIDDGVLEELYKRGCILEQEYCLVEHEVYGMLLRAKAVPWQVLGGRYPFDAIKDAALLWLNINRILMRHGLRLYDAHLGNFVMFANRPRWIDLGSIVTPDGGDGMGEFLRRFAYPLAVCAKENSVPGKRAAKFRHQGITRRKAMMLLLSAQFRLGANVQYRFTAFMKLLGTVLYRLGRFKEEDLALWAPNVVDRTQLIPALVRALRPLRLVARKTTWAAYRNPEALNRALTTDFSVEQEDPRDAVVFKTVMSCAPKRILDVGANDGFHSIMYARQGCDVLAIDRDEYAINKLYMWARERQDLKLTSSVDDFATTKHQADTVVSLALTHHLALTANMSFDFISRRYAQMSKGSLVVEYMPNGMGSTVVQPDPLPADYKLDTFLTGLRRFFDAVELVDYARPARFSVRVLIKCTGRNAVEA